LSGERFYFRRDDGKSFAGFSRPCRFDGGIQREQVGLARDGLDSPTTSPMRVAAFPSSVIVLTVR